ncbi:MAG: hypothetical protein ACP5I2_03525 [Fervidicoccaceae archaeon]
MVIGAYDSNTVYIMSYQYTEEKMECPICGKRTFVMRSLIYNMPSYGKTLLVSGKCENCGYRFTFTTPYEMKKGRIIEYIVENPEDLNTLIFIGENTDIEIPEFNFQFLSSDYEPGFITTIEGLLLKLREKLEPLCEDITCQNYLSKINEGIEGRVRFTVKLIDRYGRSEIFTNRTVKRELKE